MRIIELQKNHIKDALDLVWTVFLEFEAPDYSKQGVEEFGNFISYNSIIERFDKRKLHFNGCMDNNKLVGVIATKGINHICMLFVDKEYHRRGIARNLIQTVEDRCKVHNNVSQITVNSSPYAMEVYRCLGFVDTDKEQIVDGIRFIPMSYSIK